jgi:hypothetical protein
MAPDYQSVAGDRLVGDYRETHGMVSDSKPFVQWALVFGAVTALVISSWYVATQTYNTDFPTLYRAGKLVLVRDLPLAAIYDQAVLNSIPVPEHLTARVASESRFVWPSIAAIPLATIAWLPYYPAKALTIFLNAVAYVWAVLLCSRGVPNPSLRIRFVAVACLWLPFLTTLLFGQVNGLILLLAVVAGHAGSRGRWLISGAAVGFAAGLKVFPLGLGAFLGLMNLRIGVASVAFFGLLMIHQPLSPWLASMSVPIAAHPSFPSLLLAPLSLALLTTYVVVVMAAGITMGWAGRRLGAQWLVAMGLVTILLASPMSEYYHLTVVVVAYAQFVLPGRSEWAGRASAVVSALFLTVAWFLPGVGRIALCWLGLVMLWLGLGSQLQGLDVRHSMDC